MRTKEFVQAKESMQEKGKRFLEQLRAEKEFDVVCALSEVVADAIETAIDLVNEHEEVFKNPAGWLNYCDYSSIVDYEYSEVQNPIADFLSREGLFSPKEAYRNFVREAIDIESVVVALAEELLREFEEMWADFYRSNDDRIDAYIDLHDPES